MALTPSLSGAIHDLQARLGSIRIAVTAVAGLDLDEETRNEMLTSASEESVRAASELAGVSALAACALDATGPERVDLAASLRDAAAAARLAGLMVELPDDVAAAAHASAARVRVVVPALIRIVAGAGKHVNATATVAGERATVRLSRTGDDADTENLPALADYLVEQIGGRREPGDSALEFWLPAAPR